MSKENTIRSVAVSSEAVEVEVLAQTAWEARRKYISVDVGEEDDTGPWPPTAGAFGWREDDAEHACAVQRAEAQAIASLLNQARKPEGFATAWVWRDLKACKIGVTLHKDEADRHREAGHDVEDLFAHPAHEAGEVERLSSALADLVSWFDKPVQGINGPVWVITAGDEGADDAVTEARAALDDKS